MIGGGKGGDDSAEEGRMGMLLREFVVVRGRPLWRTMRKGYSAMSHGRRRRQEEGTKQTTRRDAPGTLTAPSPRDPIFLEVAFPSSRFG